MTLLHDTSNGTPHDDDAEHPAAERPLRVHDGGEERDDETIDLTGEDGEAAAAREEHADVDERPVHGPVQIDPSGRMTWRGMRIRRVRLLSVAKLSLIFWLLAFGVLLGTTVLVWNVARAFGVISELETAVITSLGIDAFAIDGGALFGIAAAVVAFITVLGWVMTILLAAVYNASCAVFGGLAVETGPLKRRKRVFSLRHRGFVTIRS